MAEYPNHLARRRTLAGGRSVTIRPVRADDQDREREFFDRLSGETRRLRFLNLVRPVTPELIHFFTHVDYDRHMAFVCEAEVGETPRLVGEARYVAHPLQRSCEFGVVLADDWHRTGIAGLLMDALIRFAQARGFETMEGIVLRDNYEMLRFVRGLGFEGTPMLEEPTLMRVARKL